MFRIGEFSKLSGLSADTLYHYEKSKILLPMAVDQSTGYRYYDAAQLVTVNKILALKDAGFSLGEIGHFLHGNIETSRMIEMLENKARLLESNLASEGKRLERLHTNIFLIKNGGMARMNEVTIKKVEPILVASARKTIVKEAFDESLEKMWPLVNNHIEANGIRRTIPCLMLYHSGWQDMRQWNIPYDEQSLDIEVAEPVTRLFEGSGDVAVYTLPPAGKMACIVHNGPFSTIGGAYGALYAWMEQNNCLAAGPLREIYHKGEWATDDPEEYVTELQIPIHPKFC